MCARSSASFEPMFATGKPCSKKFVVSLAVRNGQVNYLKIITIVQNAN